MQRWDLTTMTGALLLAGGRALAQRASDQGSTEAKVVRPYATADGKPFEEMDYQHAAEAFLWAYPAVSFESIRLGIKRDLGTVGAPVAVRASAKKS